MSMYLEGKTSVRKRNGHLLIKFYKSLNLHKYIQFFIYILKILNTCFFISVLLGVTEDGARSSGSQNVISACSIE